VSDPSNVVRLPQSPLSRTRRTRSAEVAGPRAAADQGIPQGPWLDADRAWSYLGFSSRKALYHALRRGQIPAHRLGKRRLRFCKAELDAYLSSQPAFGRTIPLTPVCPS
jgi:excisionase family DNA binding protein